MKTLNQFSVLLICVSLFFIKTGKLALARPIAENVHETKLVKNLTGEELCAYKILKKLIEVDSENKEKIVFFFASRSYK